MHTLSRLPTKLQASNQVNTHSCTYASPTYTHPPICPSVHLSVGYCWSRELIPAFLKLNQTLEGVFTVISSSLCFALLSLDASVQGFVDLSRRRDIVFSQAVSDHKQEANRPLACCGSICPSPSSLPRPSPSSS